MIPNKVDIGGHEILVIQTDCNNGLVFMDGVNWGMCEYNTNKIYVKSDLAPSVKEETLIHEILHRLLYSCGLKYTFLENDRKKEHELVLGLQNALYTFMKDNTDFFNEK